MKKPDETVDLIGAGINLTSQIFGLVTEFAPSKDEREQNQKNRKVRVAIRQLTHRFKNANVEAYIKVNFSNLPEEEITTLVAYVRGVVGRN